jgi:hypothetical protein
LHGFKPLWRVSASSNEVGSPSVWNSSHS